MTASAAGAGVGHRRDLDRLLVERRRGVARSGAADRRSATGGRRRSRGRAGSAASSARPRRASGRSRRWPAARSASGSTALAYVSRASGHGHAASGPIGPIVVTASASSARARSWRGSTASTSAAPSAANAIARGHGERCCGAAAEVGLGALAHPLLGGAAHGRAEGPHACGPSSPRRRAGPTSARRRPAGCAPCPSRPGRRR